ncbi:FadR family transcriptional regulator [Jeotgalibacillus proteolyticus]|uniref:FadR family transcriptional regulator n=1 Tax=Jeotgalibacillus proteolyticus TaxID=2082395 RepID=A0A2S5GDW7_9BACL|nr:FadR family transcriptional regulator [Jeotgalibacillus proteolyticus]
MPVKKTKMSQQILEQLKKMIQEGTLPPKSKLPSENELAKMFGVSRAPVREAISVLVASGLVESRQGGGNYVNEVLLVNLLDSVTLEMVTVDEVYDLLEMRTIVETEASALAATRHSDEELKAIKAALDKFSETIHDEREIGDEADFLFHKEIVSASKNTFIIQTIHNLRELYRQTLNFSLKKNLGLKRKREQVYQEHLFIYEAIRAKDPEAAAFHMKHHLTNARIKLGDTRVKPIKLIQEDE